VTGMEDEWANLLSQMVSIYYWYFKLQDPTITTSWYL